MGGIWGEGEKSEREVSGISWGGGLVSRIPGRTGVEQLDRRQPLFPGHPLTSGPSFCVQHVSASLVPQAGGHVFIWAGWRGCRF